MVIARYSWKWVVEHFQCICNCSWMLFISWSFTHKRPCAIYFYQKLICKVKYNPPMISFFVAVKGLPPYLWWPGLQYWPGMAASHHAVWTLHWGWSQGQIQPTYDFLLCSCQKGYLRISDDQACSTDPEWLPPTTLCGHYTEGEVKVKYNPPMISFFVAVKRVTSVSLMTRPAVLTWNGCLPPRCVDITLKVKSRSNTTHLWFPSL